MKDEVLRHFYFEILLQSKFCLTAYHEIRQIAPTGHNQLTLYHVQAFLVSCANLSKILFPIKWNKDSKAIWERKKARGEIIRKNLNIADTSVLKDRQFRDHFEHFDERIDDWYANPKGIGFVDMWVGTFERLKRGLPDAKPEGVLRHYDPEADTVTFKGERYELKPVVKEIQRLYDIVSPILNAP